MDNEKFKNKLSLIHIQNPENHEKSIYIYFISLGNLLVRSRKNNLGINVESSGYFGKKCQ
jgi:hypothetical protein